MVKTKSKSKKSKPTWVTKLDEGIETLDLSTYNFSGERTKKLAKKLVQNNTLTFLDMYRSRCGPVGCTAIADALGKNHTLQHLHLRSNGVKPDGVLYLSKALAHKSCALLSLDLSYNLLKDEGMIEIGRSLRGNQSLIRLFLSGNGIGAKGVEALTKPLRKNVTLTELDLSCNRLGGSSGTLAAECIAVLLQENKHLLSLNLDTNKLGNDGAHIISGAISGDTALTYLDMSANFLKEDGANALSVAARGAIQLTVSMQDNNLPIKKF